MTVEVKQVQQREKWVRCMRLWRQVVQWEECFGVRVGSGSDGEGARTNCMMTKGLSLDGVVVNRAIWIGAWVSQVPAGHGTCPMVQILTSPLSAGIFFK